MRDFIKLSAFSASYKPPQIDKTLVQHVADVLSKDPSLKGRVTVNSNNTINIRSTSSPNVAHQLSFKRV